MIHINVNLYSWCFILGIALNLIFVFLETRKYKMPALNGFALVFFEATGMLVGAKLLAAAQRGDFNIIKAGFSSLGALVGAIAMVGVYSAIFKTNFQQLLCVAILPMALTYSVGKVGCFTAGCCYGIPYNGFLSVVYDNSKSAPKDTALFPVQLAEAVAFMLIFTAFYLYYKTHEFSAKHICIYVTVLSLVKGSLYYLRNESLAKPFGSHQVICAALLVISLSVYIYIITMERVKTREQLTTEL